METGWRMSRTVCLEWSLGKIMIKILGLIMIKILGKIMIKILGLIMI